MPPEVAGVRHYFWLVKIAVFFSCICAGLVFSFPALLQSKATLYIVFGICVGSTKATSYTRGLGICGFGDTGAPGTHPLRTRRDSYISL